MNNPKIYRGTELVPQEELRMNYRLDHGDPDKVLTMTAPGKIMTKFWLRGDDGNPFGERKEADQVVDYVPGTVDVSNLDAVANSIRATPSDTFWSRAWPLRWSDTITNRTSLRSKKGPPTLADRATHLFMVDWDGGMETPANWMRNPHDLCRSLLATLREDLLNTSAVIMFSSGMKPEGGGPVKAHIYMFADRPLWAIETHHLFGPLVEDTSVFHPGWKNYMTPLFTNYDGEVFDDPLGDNRLILIEGKHDTVKVPYRIQWFERETHPADKQYGRGGKHKPYPKWQTLFPFPETERHQHMLLLTRAYIIQEIRPDSNMTQQREYLRNEIEKRSGMDPARIDKMNYTHELEGMFDHWWMDKMRARLQWDQPMSDHDVAIMRAKLEEQKRMSGSTDDQISRALNAWMSDG